MSTFNHLESTFTTDDSALFSAGSLSEIPFGSDMQSDSHPSPNRSHSPTMPEGNSPNKRIRYAVDFENEEQEQKFRNCMTRKNLNLPEVCFMVRLILKHGKENADLELLRETLTRYDSEDWRFYEFWDPDCKYTRNLVDTDDKNFTLMLLCWNRSKESPIHNHPQCECFVRCIQGSVQETRYAWPKDGDCPDRPLDIISSSVSHQGDVTLMNDSLGLHKITNAGQEGAVTLHLYFPPYQSCKLFLDSTGRESVSNVCFHTKFGHIH